MSKNHSNNEPCFCIKLDPKFTIFSKPYLPDTGDENDYQKAVALHVASLNILLNFVVRNNKKPDFFNKIANGAKLA